MKNEHETIRGLPYFVGLTSKELEIAGRALSPVEVASGEAIFAQGEDGGWIYVLARGTAEIAIECPLLPAEGAASTALNAGNRSVGERRVLASLCAPALLGEMSVLLEEPRSAWAIATSPCLLLQVSREEMRRALEANHKWAQSLLLAMSKILAARVAEMNRHLVALSLREDHKLQDTELDILQQSLYRHE